MIKKIKNQSGFTLAEMMIVIAIIGIFSTLTVVNFRGNEKVRDMDNQSRLLLDGIKRMQTSSLSGKIVSGQVPTVYIFEINKCASNCSYSLKAKNSIGDIINIDDVLLEKSAVGITGDNLRIEITPPRSDIKIYRDNILVASNEVLINLQHISDSTISKDIRINGISGRMDILNN